MICFKDQTFCCAKVHKDCGREFTEEDEAAAKKWWGGDGAPIAWMNFCGGEDRFDTQPSVE